MAKSVAPLPHGQEPDHWTCGFLSLDAEEVGVQLKSCEGSVPSTSCVGDGLSVPVGIADCCAGGESCRALGCGRDEGGELKSCEGELSCFREGELGFECTLSPRCLVCGDVSVADGDGIWRVFAGSTRALSCGGDGRPVWEGAETAFVRELSLHLSLVVGKCVGEGGTNDGLDETNGGDEYDRG